MQNQSAKIAVFVAFVSVIVYTGLPHVNSSVLSQRIRDIASIASKTMDIATVALLILTNVIAVLLRDENRFWLQGIGEENYESLRLFLRGQASRTNVAGMRFQFGSEPVLDSLCELNWNAYKNSPAFRMQYEDVRKRNLSIISRNPSAFMLFYDPLDPEKSEPIGYTCLIPLNRAGEQKYLAAQLEDSQIDGSHVCYPGQEPALVLLFATVLSKSFPLSLFGGPGSYPLYLLRCIQRHLEEFYPTTDDPTHFAPLLAQTDHRSIQQVFRAIGFERTRKKSADKCFLFEIPRPFGDRPVPLMSSNGMRDADLLATTSLQSLVHEHLVSAASVPALIQVTMQLPIRITPQSKRLIDCNDAADPISRQYVPSVEELVLREGEMVDAVGDTDKEVTSGLIHKFPDRVLLKLASVCATYCRFCFRREALNRGLPYMSEDDFAAALSYIRDRPAIWEVILSGGDPLVLDNRKLTQFIRRIAGIPHVKVIRIHSKVPIVSPERITPLLCVALKCDKAVWISVHCNHPRELTREVTTALDTLTDAGITLVSQTVLLKGVNDQTDVLEELFRSLVEARVKPYYLHQADLVRGTGHFRVPIERGQQLMRELTAKLSGICLPNYVVDLPHGYGKVPINPSWAAQRSPTEWEISGNDGVPHLYEEV